MTRSNSSLSLFFFQGRQEDAEEFLGCVLDGLHEEMVSAMKSLQSEKEKASGEDGQLPLLCQTVYSQKV